MLEFEDVVMSWSNPASWGYQELSEVRARTLAMVVSQPRWRTSKFDPNDWRKHTVSCPPLVIVFLFLGRTDISVEALLQSKVSFVIFRYNCYFTNKKPFCLSNCVKYYEIISLFQCRVWWRVLWKSQQPIRGLDCFSVFTQSRWLVSKLGKSLILALFLLKRKL